MERREGTVKMAEGAERRGGGAPIKKWGIFLLQVKL